MSEHISDFRSNRWIKVSADFANTESTIFAEDEGVRLCKSMAWLWLLSKAAWKDRRAKHKNRMIDIKRGQVLIGRAYLAKQWGWSEQNVRTFLKALEDEDMISIDRSAGHFANLATIVNYRKYQDVPEAEIEVENKSTIDPPEPNQCLTSASPEPNQTLTSTTSYRNTHLKRERTGSKFWEDALRTKPAKIWIEDDELRLEPDYRQALGEQYGSDRVASCLLIANGSVTDDTSERALLRLFNRQLGYATKDEQTALAVSAAKDRRTSRVSSFSTPDRKQKSDDAMREVFG